MSSRVRGSLTDAVSLRDYPFTYQPEIKDKITTGFALREILGNALPSVLWVGQGVSLVDLEVFLLGDGDTLERINDFKSLTAVQSDTAAPHPLFINTGGIYVGHLFVLVEVETKYTVLTYDASMRPFEAHVQLKFVEIPVHKNYAGTGG